MKKSYLLQTFLFVFFLAISPIYAEGGDNEPTSEQIEVKSNTFTSVTDPGWSYTCKDGIEVELISLGLKNNVPTSLAIPNSDNVERIVVEIVYKGRNPGETIEIEDADGNSYIATREVPSGGSLSVWYYRTELPATSSVDYSNTNNANYAQSMLAYVFRNKNTGIASSGVFTAIGGYNNIETITIPIVTDSGARSVKIELPVSELTADGRYIKLTASTSDGKTDEIIETIDDFPSGNCCIKVFTLGLEGVAGDVDEVTITIDTRNKQNGQSVNGQSWVMGGAVKTDVACSCIDFDDEPPVADNLIDHILLEDISQMPKVTFTDGCSAVTVEYNEYDGNQSCGVGFGPVFEESNLWFENFPFDKFHHWEYGYFEKFLDNSAKVHGRVVNNSDPTSGWMVEIFFETLVDYTAWVASSGYLNGDDLEPQRMFANVDFTKPYTFDGFGDYTNSTITLLSNTNLHHMDIGPRDVYGDFGMGFLISYEGSVNGQPIIAGDGGQQIEMNASLERCVDRRARLIIREWIVTDASGNSQVFIQRVELEE